MTIDERQAWLMFVGLLAAVLGATLACDAQVHAEALEEWPGMASGVEAKSAVAWYRGIGTAFVVAGAALAVAALLAPQKVSGRFQLFRFNDQGRIAGGVIFILIGSTLAAARLIRAPALLGIKAGLEPGSQAEAGRRRWSAVLKWARAGLITLYGCFLLSRIGGVPR